MATGRGGFNRTARVLLHEMRWRPPPRETGLRIVAWFGSLLLHLLVAMAMLIARPPLLPATAGGGGDEAGGAIEVRLISSAASTATPPPPPPIQLPRRIRHSGRSVRAPHAGPLALPRPAPQPQSIAPLQMPQLDVDVAPPALQVAAPQPRPAPRPPAPTLPQAPQPQTVRPSPPRIVLEPSPMELPPPKLKAPALTAPQPQAVAPAPVPAVAVAPEVQAPQVSVQLPSGDRPAIRAPAPVTAPEVAAAPPIPVSPTRPPAVTPPAATPPSPADTRPIVRAAAPVTATPAPAPPLPVSRVAVPAPQLEASVPQARPGPLSAPPSPLKVLAPVPVPPPARTPSAPTEAKASTVPPTSWADSLARDHFATPVRQPGKGLHLYGQHGSLAFGSGGKGPVRAYIQRMPQGNSDVMTRRGSAGFVYRSTRFDQYWVPYGQSALDSMLQRLVDKLTYTQHFDLPRGIHGECKVSPIMVLLFSCHANPPPIPTADSNDPRLDMAPAQPLAPGLGTSPPAPPASVTLPHRDDVTCATARVAGSPPPPGCPGSGKASDQW